MKERICPRINANKRELEKSSYLKLIYKLILFETDLQINPVNLPNPPNPRSNFLLSRKFGNYRYDSLFYDNTTLMNHLSKIFLISGLFLCMSFQISAKTISFSGFEWTVRSNGYGAPGKNYWRSDNVWVDELGRLHLTIRNVGGRWTCAELQTTQKFLYGKYSFKVVGRIDQFDKNVVLGLFNYPTEAVKQGLGEIDIEFAKWGNAANGSGNFTVWSDAAANQYQTKTFPFALVGTYTKHNFTRAKKSVLFQSFHGHSEANEIFNWKYSGADVSKTPMPIYLNFWLYRGLAPSDGNSAEIIISEVKYSP